MIFKVTLIFLFDLPEEPSKSEEHWRSLNCRYKSHCGSEIMSLKLSENPRLTLDNRQLSWEFCLKKMKHVFIVIYKIIH